MKRLLIISAILLVFTPALIYAQEIETTQVCAQAEADAERDVNSTLWLGGGCLLGLIGLGAAYLIEPSPPAMRLVGKSPEYVAAYSDCYKAKGKSIQTKNATIGCVVGYAVTGVLYVLLYSLAAD